MTRRERGFTLVELLVVVAIGVTIMVLAAPSFKQMVQTQRLKSVGSQVVTDMQFARSEAVSRQRRVYVSFSADDLTPPGDTLSCYVVHTCATDAVCQCDCTANAGSRCPAAAAPLVDPQELRTHRIERSLGLRQDALLANAASAVVVIEFEPVTGGMVAYTSGPLGLSPPTPLPVWIETRLFEPSPTPNLRTEVSTTGRPNLCAVAGRVAGITACLP